MKTFRDFAMLTLGYTTLFTALHFLLYFLILAAFFTWFFLGLTVFASFPFLGDVAGGLQHLLAFLTSPTQCIFPTDLFGETALGFYGFLIVSGAVWGIGLALATSLLLAIVSESKVSGDNHHAEVVNPQRPIVGLPLPTTTEIN